MALGRADQAMFSFVRSFLSFAPRSSLPAAISELLASK